MRNSIVSILCGISLAWPVPAALAQGCGIAGRTIELILDALGSMNAKLPSGETRIEVARRAIK